MIFYTIKGKAEKDILDVSLENILKVLESKCNKLNWRLLWIDAVMNPRFGMNILEIEKFVNNSNSGIELSYPYLLKLSEQIYQGINLLVIGDESLEKLKRYDTSEEMYKNCMVTLELIDGSYWDFHSHIPDLEANIISLSGAEKQP